MQSGFTSVQKYTKLDIHYVCEDFRSAEWLLAHRKPVTSGSSLHSLSFFGNLRTDFRVEETGSSDLLVSTEGLVARNQ